MTYTQLQKSVRSKDRVDPEGRTDRQTGGRIALPSRITGLIKRANVIPRVTAAAAAAATSKTQQTTNSEQLIVIIIITQ